MQTQYEPLSIPYIEVFKSKSKTYKQNKKSVYKRFLPAEMTLWFEKNNVLLGCFVVETREPVNVVFHCFRTQRSIDCVIDTAESGPFKIAPLMLP